MIADTGRLGSLDVMELNPALDVRNKTAALAVDLIESPVRQEHPHAQAGRIARHPVECCSAPRFSSHGRSSHLRLSIERSGFASK